MPGRKLGQHFLIRKSVLERIAAAVCGPEEPLAVEIGPGRGALTGPLLERACRVVAIELDPDLAAHLRQRFGSRLELVEADVLDLDLARWGPAVFAGNLPYYISSPIFARIIAARSAVRRAVFLVQKEVAQRVAASPGSRDYGYLSVTIQLFFRPDLLFDVKPGAFSPPPKVDSAVVRLTPHRGPAELGIEDPDAFLRFAGLCFQHKRKTLRNNLAGVYGKQAVDGLPEAGRRAEELTLLQFAHLYRRLVG